MDPNVYDLVHKSVTTVPYPRSDTPPELNPHYAFLQNPKKDIANTDIRPDVWVKTAPMVNPAPSAKQKEEPKLNPDYVHKPGDIPIDKNGYIKSFYARQAQDINCDQYGLPSGSTACRRRDWGDDVKPVPRTEQAPVTQPSHYTGNEGHLEAERDGTLKYPGLPGF